MTERLTTEVTLLQRQTQEQGDLLKARKSHKRGKRVRLEGEFVYSTEKVLEVAREEEEERAAKKARTRRRRQPSIKSEDEEEEEDSEYIFGSSDNDVVVVVPRRRS